MNYDLLEPSATTTGVVFASPHSGRAYPANMRKTTVLDELALRSSEDAYVDRLIADAPLLGAPLLLARTPRAFVDLNRSPDELDPAVIEGVRRVIHNPRVTSGLGVIPRVVANGRAIYRGKIPLSEARRRIDDHWHPYHAALRALLQRQRAAFGIAVLVDCHSMPHEAIEGMSSGRGPVPDVVLGDRFGAAADAGIVDRIEAAFTAEGLRVARNAPFAGAFIAQRYGRPTQGTHVVQIEIDRALYMDEARVTPLPRFDELRGLMRRVMSDIVDIARPELPLAAE
ncbi:N-formylglutamate amidohydrolase [Meridianimarinicoccus roseus]|uniref:N-formylglutamate amidohydrolase n=1 Tax=Meridianimarinicoccus roseus TaxID=2072018 RepID=UPI001EE682D5|nr:N-formylglutamate amidohydrolase [Meridianimarinicoccus roseus]